MDQMEQLRQALTSRCPSLEIRVNEPMSRHTSFRIGGPAALMALPKSEEEAICAVETANQYGVEPFFMGNGSNLLVPDEGVKRFLVKSVPGLCSCETDGVYLKAGSGISLARLATYAREQELTGLEFAHGIPGSLGGAVTMNAGAYGGEMAQVVPVGASEPVCLRIPPQRFFRREPDDPVCPVGIGKGGSGRNRGPYGRAGRAAAGETAIGVSQCRFHV